MYRAMFRRVVPSTVQREFTVNKYRPPFSLLWAVVKSLPVYSMMRVSFSMARAAKRPSPVRDRFMVKRERETFSQRLKSMREYYTFYIFACQSLFVLYYIYDWSFGTI
mgnify:CR=1 FL=1